MVIHKLWTLVKLWRSSYTDYSPCMHYEIRRDYRTNVSPKAPFHNGNNELITAFTRQAEYCVLAAHLPWHPDSRACKSQ